jgi:hypothetical protein
MNGVEWSAPRFGYFTLGERIPGTECIGGWAPEMVWTWLRREDFPLWSGIESRRPARSQSVYQLRGSCRSNNNNNNNNNDDGDDNDNSNNSCNYTMKAYKRFLARWFAELILRPWRWRRYVPPRRRVQLNVLHGDISQKMVLFITTAVKTSNPTRDTKLGLQSF